LGKVFHVLEAWLWLSVVLLPLERKEQALDEAIHVLSLISIRNTWKLVIT
jgi:hypothetical protein